MAETRKLATGEYLFKEGDFPDNMYIVRSGGLVITKTKNKSEVELAEIGTGAIVGEMALFDKKPRSANVKATKETDVVALPYKGLEQQLTQLPEWIRAIVRTLNQNLREANLKIKVLGETLDEEVKFPPQLINKLLAVVNLVTLRHGKKEKEGLSIPPGLLRKMTIQVFQLPTHKMTALLSALEELKMFEVLNLEDQKQTLINLKPEFFYEFVEWHNDWLMKSDDERFTPSADELQTMRAIVHYARKNGSLSGFDTKLNTEAIQALAKVDLNVTITMDGFQCLIARGLCSEKMITKDGIFVGVVPTEIEVLSRHLDFLRALQPLLE